MPPKRLLTLTTSRSISGLCEAFMNPPSRRNQLFQPAGQPSGHEDQDDHDDHPKKEGIDLRGHHRKHLAQIDMNKLPYQNDDKTAEKRPVEGLAATDDDDRNQLHQQGKAEHGGHDKAEPEA